MVNFSKRSYEKELLDRDDIPFADIKQNMQELNTVNTLLGGHAITLKGLKAFLKTTDKKTTFIICEIGCGGGDNLFALAGFCEKNNIRAKFIGIDLKAECIEFAQQQYPKLNCNWICNDYAKIDFKSDKPSIVFSSLFCHHFTDEQLTAQILWLKHNSLRGFFINDLHRNYIAYYAIRFITSLVSKSYLVKNDAPLSVARGFKKADWQRIFADAGILEYEIRWKWAFRYLIIFTHD